MSVNQIDFGKLENLQTKIDGWNAACPICRKEGRDKKGNHLSILRSGAFSCICNVGDKDHSRKIYHYLYTGKDIEIEEQEEFIFRGNKLKFYPEELLNKLLRNYSYWENRNIPKDITSLFSGGLTSRDEAGKLKGRYVFAIRNKDDKIVGWAGRLIEHSEFAPKWKIIGNKKSFVFPDRKINDKEIKKKKQIILLESIADCLMLFKHEIRNSIVMFGVKPSSQLISYLISLGVEEVIISTNNDSEKNNVGNDAAEKIKRQLSLFFNPEKIKIILPQRFKDFGEADEQEILNFKKRIE